MKQKNEDAQLRLTVEAARNGAKLIVLPEMNQVGYCFTSREEISPYVEPVPGPTTERYAEVARRHEAHIVVGLAEVNPETKNYYNSQALIGPDGFIGKYRKTHSYISEPRWAKDGNLGFPVFSTEIGNLGMLVCMDYHFFESSRVSSLKGADVMCFSSAWLDERGPPPVWITRSSANGIYAVCADRWGLVRGVQFTGGSRILNPDGSIQSWRDAGDGIVYGEIDIDRARNKEFPVGDDDRLKDRLPENYMQVTQSTYLWSPQKFFALYGDRQVRPAGPPRARYDRRRLHEQERGRRRGRGRGGQRDEGPHVRRKKNRPLSRDQLRRARREPALQHGSTGREERGGGKVPEGPPKPPRQSLGGSREPGFPHIRHPRGQGRPRDRARQHVPRVFQVSVGRRRGPDMRPLCTRISSPHRGGEDVDPAPEANSKGGGPHSLAPLAGEGGRKLHLRGIRKPMRGRVRVELLRVQRNLPARPVRLPQERDRSRFRRGPPQLDDRHFEPRAGQPVQSGESEVPSPDEAAILVRSSGHPPGRKAPQSSSIGAERWKRVEPRF